MIRKEFTPHGRRSNTERRKNVGVERRLETNMDFESVFERYGFVDDRLLKDKRFNSDRRIKDRNIYTV